MKAIKSLSFFIKSSSGRDNYGHLTSANKGGGFKKFYYVYDNYRKVFNLPFIIIKRKAYFYKSFFLDMICYVNGFLSFVKSTSGLSQGNINFCSGSKYQFSVGDSIRLKYLVVGTLVHSLENFPGSGAVFCRSMGVYSKVVCQYGNYTLIQFSSGEQRLLSNLCFCVVGQIAYGKSTAMKLNAGKNRKLGKRPHVRGVSKNSVDHPNGGRTKGGAAYKDR